MNKPVDPIDTFTDAELDAMALRAWREAARCWQEYRATWNTPLSAELRRILADAAESAESHFQHLTAELHRRLAETIGPA